MPIFDVEFADGTVVPVNAPQGTPEADIARLATEQRQGRRAEPPRVETPRAETPRAPARSSRAQQLAELEANLARLREQNRRAESGFLENFLTGFGSGAVNVAELGALGIAALADEEAELKARDTIQSMASALRPEGGDPESLTYGLGAAFGSAVAPLGVAGLAGLAAAPLGAGAATAAALGTAGGLGIGAAAGEQSERARAAGVSEEERSRRVLQAAPIGALEAVPFIRGAKRLFGVVEDVAQNIPRGSMQRIRSALATGGEEAATEAAAGALQNAVEQGYNPNRAILESGLAEEAGYGAVVGATIQALVDLAAGRRLRNLPAAEEPPPAGQLEMFPGEDLGTRPEEIVTEDEIAQLEMFAQEEMGRPPERADERQLDLFAAREPAAGPEPDQRDFVEDLEAQRIDTEARDRLALAAAERGDEAAFDQPDLFPLELEQTERRLGREPVEAPRAEEPIPAAPEGEQLDLVTRAEEEVQLEQMQADEDAQRARQARLQMESELETLEGQRLSTQERATQERRRSILLDTIEANPNRNYAPVIRAYRDALSAEGLRDAAPTEQEVATIRRAVNVQRAVEAPPEQIEAAPEATQLSELEAQIPERRARQETVAPEPEVAQVTPEAVTPEGAPSEPVAAVPEPVIEPGAATPRAEPAPSGVGPADGGAVAGVVRDGGRGRGARRAGAEPEVGAIVPEAPAARPVARPSVPPAEPVDGARAQPRSLETDAAALQSLGTKKGTADDAAMRAYLASGRNLDQSVRNLAYDLVTREPGAPAEGVTGIGGTPGKGGKLAPADRALRWIRSNMSPEVNARLNAAIQRQVEEVRNVTLSTAIHQADPDSAAPIDTTNSKRVKLAMQMAELVSQPNPDFAAIAPVRKKLSRLLELETALDTPLPGSAMQALQNNNLTGAVNSIAESIGVPRLRGMATRLAAAVGNTQVQIQEGLTNDAGMPIAGAFDPRTNTITLDAARGVNTHTVMHELTHAVTADAIANRPNSAPVKQLQRIFDAAKDQLGTFYGARSLDEFVSEAFSNPLFQQELAKIKVPRSPYTYWQQFKNAVANIVRVLRGQETKGLSSALDMTDRLVSDMMAPAPEFRDAGRLLMETTQPRVSKLAKRMDSIQRALPEPTRESFENFTANVSSFLEGTAASKAKEWLLATLPFQALADTAQKRGVEGAFDLQKAINEQEGRMAQSDEQIDVVLREAEDWMKKNRDKVDTFNDVVYTSTVEQVDPTRPQKDYEQSSEDARLNNLGKEFKPEQVEIWKKLNKDLKSMPGAQRIYTMMRDTYKTKYEQLKDVIYGRIDGIAELDDAARNTLKKEVYSRIFNEGTIDPYFPLTRTGNFWLSYNTTNGEFVVEAFESPLARDRAIMQLEADTEVDSATLQKFQNITQASFDNAPSTSFVGQTLQVLRANKVSEETQTEIARLFIEALPESSFAKSLKRRKGKGTLGFKEDSVLAMKQKAYDLGRQVERLRSAAKIRRISDDIQEQFGPGTNKIVIEELLRRARFATNPPADNLARNANRLAFLGTIGFNASSALVNLSQIPLVVVPFLSGKYGFNQSMKATKDAYKLIFGSGTKRKIRLLTGETEAGDADVEVGAMPSIDNYYELDADGNFKIRDDVKLPQDPKEAEEFRARLERLRPLVQEASTQGQLNRSLFYDTLGIESSGRDRNIWDRINAWSAAGFHAVERANRQVALVSAYELELNRLETKPTKEEANLSTEEKQQLAAGTALYNAQQTNGGSVLATAPRIAQQGIGRVAMMYKSYGIQMYYLQLKLFRDMLESSGLPVEQRKEAMRQLATIQLSALMFSGVQGLTLVGIATAVANMFRDDDEEDAETSLRKYLGEGWYKGPINQLLGVDVASRIGLSNLLFRENRYNRDPSNEETLVQALGGPAWSTTSQFIRGFQEIMEGDDLQRGLETMAPAAVRNALKTIRVANAGGYETRRLDPITDDISTGLLVAQVMGFSPAEYTRIQEMNSSTKGIDLATNKRRTKLLRKLYVARRARDFDEIDNLQDEIAQFNRDHPDPDVRITRDTIERSMRGHMQRSVEMYNGITISPNMKRTLELHRAEFGD